MHPEAGSSEQIPVLLSAPHPAKKMVLRQLPLQRRLDHDRHHRAAPTGEPIMVPARVTALHHRHAKAAAKSARRAGGSSSSQMLISGTMKSAWAESRAAMSAVMPPSATEGTSIIWFHQ